MSECLDYKKVLLERLDLEMIKEDRRLETFGNDWKYDRRISKENMAMAGFYYVRETSQSGNVIAGVRCFACRKTLKADWSDGMDPWMTHSSTWSGSDPETCPFARKWKPISQFTVEEYIDLLAEMEVIRIEKIWDICHQTEHENLKETYGIADLFESSSSASSEENDSYQGVRRFSSSSEVESIR